MRSDFAGFLFDAPGAGAGSIQGTVPFSINPAGAIAGNYSDPSNVNHGFLLARDGTISKFDAPGASPGSGQGTFLAREATWFTASCGFLATEMMPKTADLTGIGWTQRAARETSKFARGAAGISIVVVFLLGPTPLSPAPNSAGSWRDENGKGRTGRMTEEVFTLPAACVVTPPVLLNA